jgi:D-aminoacyl-tRNA deacylase
VFPYPKDPIPWPPISKSRDVRLVLQRVKSARVEVHSKVVASIDRGILVLVGFGREDEDRPDSAEVLAQMARKLVQVRIFPNDVGKLDFSLMDIQGAVLAVSQFTLHADCRKGRRPSLHDAARPDAAAKLFTSFVVELNALLADKVQSGCFGKEMDVILNNWGPLTLVWDSWK